MEKHASWKTFAVVLGSVAALITAVATLLPSLQPYFAPDEQSGEVVNEEAGAQSTAEGPVEQAQERDPSPVPSPVEPLTDAQALRAAEKATTEYIVAMRKADVDQMVALADPPFFLDQGELLLTKSEIRQRIVDAYQSYDPNEPLPNPDSIKARLIGDAKSFGWSSRSDRFTSRLNLDDADIQVAARFGGEGIAFYFRREPDRVLLAGLWD
jgi:hypothetical protein